MDEVKFSDYVDAKMLVQPKRYNAIKLEKTIRKNIIVAANKHDGVKKITQTSKCWMSKEIKEAIAKRNKLRKSRGTNRSEWIKSCQEVSKMIHNRRKDLWKKYVEELDIQTNPSEVWKTIRNMDGRHPPE